MLVRCNFLFIIVRHSIVAEAFQGFFNIGKRLIQDVIDEIAVMDAGCQGIPIIILAVDFFFHSLNNRSEQDICLLARSFDLRFQMW